MKYQSALKKLRKIWPVDIIACNCTAISNDLGKIIYRQFPRYNIFTARSDNLYGKRLVVRTNHQVSVIKENDERFLALDATRPLYEKGSEFWIFTAKSTSELMQILKSQYSGDWRLNQRYNPKYSWYDELYEK